MREMIIRLKHMFKVKGAKLVERFVHLNKLEMELRSCIARMTQLCSCGTDEAYRAEISFREVMRLTEMIEREDFSIEPQVEVQVQETT